MIAALYDWSGFYIGANGGWGSSRSSWDFLPGLFVTFGEGSHDASGGTVGGQVGYRWQAGTWVFGVEAQGNWADFKGSNISLFDADGPQRIARRCVRLVHRPGRLRSQQRPVLRQGRCGCDFERVPLSLSPPTRSLASPATTPVGAARSASASNTASPRTGRLVSNTITCSCRTVPTPSPRRVAASSAPIASIRTSILSPPA